MQINLNHCRDANGALEEYVNNNKIDVILGQDPYVVRGVVTGIPREWSCFLSDNLSAVIIITNRDYICLEALKLTNSIFINLNVSNTVLYIGSQYSAPSADLDSDLSEWSNIFKDFDNLVVGGDFNAPLVSMGYTRENNRSEELMEHLMLYSLSICNDPEAPHSFVQGSITGRPDLTLLGLNLCDKIESWMVDDKCFSFSDHRYIKFSLDFEPTKKANLRFKTKNKSFKKLDKLIDESCGRWTSSLSDVYTGFDLDIWAEKWQDDINKMMNKCFRRGKITHKTTNYWYTPELKSMRNKINALYKRYVRNSQIQEYREVYVKERNIYKRKIREAKKKSWLKFCSSTNNAFGNLYKFLSGKNLHHTDFIYTALENSVPFATYDDVADDLMKEHFHVDIVPPITYEYISRMQYDGDPDFRKTTDKEIEYVIKQQANGKAPGPDELDAIIVKHICKRYRLFVKQFFDKCLGLGHFPRIWKCGQVIFFRKRNKSPHSSRGYRPITLLSIFGKLLERIIKIRIMTKLESISYFEAAQHGFREGNSTITALYSLKSMVKEKLESGKYCTLISLDIEGAFDTVCWKTLSKIIDDLPIPVYLRSILKNYISNRKIGFLFSEGIRWFALNRGCPQGSCIGPLMWILVADTLLKVYKQSFSDIVSYADDFVIIIGGNTRRSLEEKANMAIDLFNDVCQELRLKLSVNKCESMMFGPNQMINRRPIFKLQDTSIPVKDNVNYLGFKLDGRFNWMDHFDQVRENIMNFIINIGKTGCRDTGLAAHFKKTWYKVVIEKRILYGWEVWFPDLKIHAIRRLSSCQRSGLMSIIKAYRDVSTEALCVLAGIEPIYIKLKNDFEIYSVVNGSSQLYLEDICINRENVMRKLRTYDYPEYLTENNINIISSVREVNPVMHGLVTYTDGSKMESGTSAAFAVYLHGANIFDYKIKLHKLNSIFQAELTAIKYAVDWFDNSSFNRMILYSDSYSSIQVLQHTFPDNKIIMDTFKIMSQSNNKKLSLGWIKAHAGYAGNERADTLAKNVIENEEFDIMEVMPFPISTVKRYYKVKALSDWQESWNSSTVGRDTYNVFNEVTTDRIIGSRVVHYYCTGHGSFPKYLKKIGKRSNDLCDCGQRGDILHYLFGRCRLMPHHFAFDNFLTVRKNIQKTLLSFGNYNKLRENYNKLNELYSFIRYKF